MMKRLSTGLCALTVLLVISSLRPVQAQTTSGVARTAAPFDYDVRDEVTVPGTVTSIVTKAAPGMIAGSHLLLATSSGPVDASLGRFGLHGYGAASVAAGQQIEVTGVMRTIEDKHLFLVRTLKVGGEVYTIRNQHGVQLSPQARERAEQKTGQTGESR
ncbi:MAG: hypothetical protein WBQ00_11110 [Terriglobales bacterium]